MPVNRREEPVVVAVATHDLPDTGVLPPSEPLEPDKWRRLLGLVERQRLTGLLAGAVADGSLPTTESQRPDVADRHRAAMATALHLEARLLEAAEVLDEAALPWRVLKGSASAHLDYSDPALRVYGDTDLLVPSERLHAAVEALGALGARRSRPPLGAAFEQRFAKTVELADEGGWEFDVHRTLALEPFGLRIDEQELFAGAESFRVGGRELWALDTERRFLLACYHTSLGNFPTRLGPLRDVAGLATRPALDVDGAVAVAERWWAGAVVADAVCRAWDVFALPSDHPLARWAAARQPSRDEAVALAAFQRRDRRQAHRTLATLRTLPGVGTRAAYLRGILLPDRAYLDSRGTGPLRWLRRGRGAATARSAP